MANSLKGKIWTLDTAGSTAVTTDPCKVKKVRWDSETSTDNENVVITDPVTGGVLWSSTTIAVTTSEEALVEEWWLNGFKLLTKDSGTVYVHLE